MISAFQNVKGGARKLNTGFYIPLIGLGTYKLKGEQMKPAVDAALSCGYRMFDTAKYYENESDLGEALSELLPKYDLSRTDIFLTTKLFPDPDDPAGGANKLLMESLKMLRTDYIDMVLIHYPKAKELDEKDERNSLHRKLTYLELEKLKDEGKIRSVGVSNYESRHIEEIKCYGKMMPCANQVEYHPHFTRDQLKNYCAAEGIFFQVDSPGDVLAFMHFAATSVILDAHGPASFLCLSWGWRNEKYWYKTFKSQISYYDEMW
ncbi:glyoxal reductase family protein [Dictyocaulus viviparus]|uniref:Glyoxal reductase family protein n=1 Tax=Dictyocaulus viviparus TaxID=29172 RepID=A0A0D8Y8B7_DICVI|nr:glyoxal reductase family protein [Dictyocaulus viviparus]